MSTDRQRAHASEVVARLRESGYQAYWAGGCVRDLLLGLDPSDFDVATDARPEQVGKLFRRTCAVGESFGVVRVLGNRETGDVEVATFRSDGVYLDGRRPETVTYSTAEFDASRRDFTINGMFYDPVEGRVIDYVGGRDDLDAKLLRAIGDPAARFAVDKLRLLRAVRFAARFDLAIEPATRSALESMAGQVASVAAERIAQEFRKMLSHRSRVAAMNLAYDTGLVAAVLPQLVAMKGLFQGKPIQPDGDLWDHTMLVLANLPDNPSFTLALGALLHDVGKPATRLIREDKLSFHGHEQVGRELAIEVSRNLKLANAERDRVAWLVGYHQYLGDAKRLRESKLKRLLASDGIEELLALHRADALASIGEAPHVDYCEWYLREQPAGPINPPPLLTGHDLVRHGLAPGPMFAVWLDSVREAQLDRTIHSKREALELVDRLPEEKD